MTDNNPELGFPDAPQGENDPLMGAPRGRDWKGMTPRGSSPRGADLEGNLAKDGKQQGHRNGWNIVFGWMKYTFGPAMLFMIVSILFMVGYHQNPRLLLGLATFLVLALLSDAWYIYSARNKLTMRVLGFSACTAAVFFGGLVGTSLHLDKLVDYWPYYQKRHYTNVAPDELASAHADASVLVFMEGTRPDGSRYAGYSRYGSIYCVAPIAVDASKVEGEEATSSVVQYWAIGKNCCGGHQGFACDDAQNEYARSGLVMSTKEDDNALFGGVLSSNDMAYYEKAVLMSLTEFDLSSPPERMFVRFVADIETARMAYWGAAWWSWGKLQLIWLPAWMFAGAMAVLVGIGDPDDDSRYHAHIVDFKQSVLLKANHYM